MPQLRVIDAPPSSSDAVPVQARAMFGANNGDMMRDAAIAGLGLAMLPAFIVGPTVKAGELQVVALDVEPDEEFAYMAHAQVGGVAPQGGL